MLKIQRETEYYIAFHFRPDTFPCNPSACPEPQSV
jgi:hypothetical protein